MVDNRRDHVSLKAHIKSNKIDSNIYPLQKLFFVIGIVLGTISIVLSSSFVLGFSVFSLFLILGMLWRRDEPPIFAFAITYQWFFLTSGYFFELFSGRYPNYSLVGDLERAIFYSLIGFIFIAIGIRVVFYLFRKNIISKLGQLKKINTRVDTKKLFYFVVAIHIVNWFIAISPTQINFNTAQIIGNVLALQDVLLLTLFFVVLNQNEGYKYALFAFFISVVPRFTSTHSTFKAIFFLVIIALITEWKPWSRNSTIKDRNSKILVFLSFLFIVLLYFAVLWEGAIKPNWRIAEVEGKTTERLEQFYYITKDPISSLNVNEGFEDLIARIWSVEQFSLVLERVPSIYDHENGMLLLKTLEHILKPRFLFPDKPVLKRDSWMTEKYAGIKVHRNTSVGIGYMAEFYVDFGIPLMFLMTILYGMLLGFIYVFITTRATSYYLFLSCVTIPFSNNFLEYEGNFTKLVGGIIVSVFVITIFLIFLSPWFNSKISVKKRKSLVNSNLISSRYKYGKNL